MHILFIGGTRYFGKVIVRKLLDLGHNVTIFSRGNSQPDFWGQVEHIQGDRTQHDEFTKKLRGREFDAVIDNVAFTVEDTRAVVSTFQGRTGKCLVTSTVSVYGGIGHAKEWQTVSNKDRPRQLREYVDLSANCPLRETDLDLSTVSWNYDPGINEYAQAKRQIEKYLQESPDFPSVVLRVPVTVGPEERAGRFWWYMQRIQDGQEIILRDGGSNIFRLGFRDDIAQAFIDALDSPNTTNQTYNICQDEIVTLRRFVEIVAKHLGYEANVVSVSGDAAERLTDLPWTDWRFDPFSRPPQYIMSTEKAHRDFQLRNAPMNEWVRQTVQWHQERHDGTDSAFYSLRDKEIAFAVSWREQHNRLIESMAESTESAI